MEVMVDIPNINRSMERMTETMSRRNNPAGYMLERLTSQLKAFQTEIDDEAEIGINVVGGGSNGKHEPADEVVQAFKGAHRIE